MKRKFTLIAVAAAAASLLTAADAAKAAPAAAPVAKRVALHLFEGRQTITAWPADARQRLTHEANAEMKSKVMRVVNGDAKSTVFYGTSALPVPGPATLVITCDYKIVGAKAFDIPLTMNYNLPGKGNGSAGKQQTTVKYSDKWAKFKYEFKVPATVNGIQYIWVLSGANNEFLMDNCKLEIIPDAAPAAK